jgi:hypothetical protein
MSALAVSTDVSKQNAGSATTTAARTIRHAAPLTHLDHALQANMCSIML